MNSLTRTRHGDLIRPAISCPAIDFTESFPTLGSAAGLGSNFDPFENDMNFLLGAYVFEDVGVTAYHGALTLITNPAYLDKAGGILAVEAYHAGIIPARFSMLTARTRRRWRSPACAPASTAPPAPRMRTITASVRSRIGDTVDNQLASDAIENGSLLGSFPTNNPPGNNAITYDRTTRQVLNIVYGSPGMRRAACSFQKGSTAPSQATVSTTIGKPQPMPSVGGDSILAAHSLCRTEPGIPSRTQHERRPGNQAALRNSSQFFDFIPL